MLIGVVSDTHLAGEPIPGHVIEMLSGSDMILHAGDVLEMRVIEQLSVLAPTFAVRGNMDRRDVELSLPASRVVEAEGFRIGLTHGWGSSSGMPARIESEFTAVDCIVFGHTHNSLVGVRDGLLFFNPGSPTDRKFASRNTIGFLEVTDIISPRIVDVVDQAG